MKCNPGAESWLEYRGLSIVYFQIFTLMDECNECEICKVAEKLEECGYVRQIPPGEAIDKQIFVYSMDVSPIKKYKLRGFSFKLTLEDENDIDISGEMQVEMSIFNRKVVSLTYRMVIDDYEI